MKLYRVRQSDSDVLGGLITKDNAFFLSVAGVKLDQPHLGWVDLPKGATTTVFDKRGEYYQVTCEEEKA